MRKCVPHASVGGKPQLAYTFTLFFHLLAPITRTNYSQLGQHFPILLNIEKPSREVNMI